MPPKAFRFETDDGDFGALLPSRFFPVAPRVTAGASAPFKVLPLEDFSAAIAFPEAPLTFEVIFEAAFAVPLAAFALARGAAAFPVDGFFPAFLAEPVTPVIRFFRVASLEVVLPAGFAFALDEPFLVAMDVDPFPCGIATLRRGAPAAFF